MPENVLRDEDYVCSNCKYYGCDRSKNCDTICDKWTISEFVLEELIEEKTGINTMTAEDPMKVVAIGTGQFVEFMSVK